MNVRIILTARTHGPRISRRAAPDCRRQERPRRRARAADLRVRRAAAPARIAGGGGAAASRRPRCRRSSACARASACRSSPAATAPGCPAARCRSPAALVIALARLNRILERRHSEPARHRRTRRHQPRDHAPGRAVRLLLRARSVEPAGLLDRRQRRRELRRRALPEVRLHRAPRARRRGRAARRRARARSAARSPTRPDPICSAS